ncbi:hypothetical protein D3C79_626390 [compost metagenome]
MLVGDCAEVKALDQLGDTRCAVSLGQIEQSGVQFQVLAHAQLAIQRETLRHETDPLARGQVFGVHGSTQQGGAAFAGRHQSGEHFHGGGLAAAVGAEKAEDFTATDGEADLVHRSEIPKAQGQFMRFDRNRRVAVRARRNLQGLRGVCTVALVMSEGVIQLAAGGDAGKFGAKP